MRCIFPLMLCALLAAPLHARAEDDDGSEQVPKLKKHKKKGKKKHHKKTEVKEPKGEMRFDDLNSNSVAKPAAEPKPPEAKPSPDDAEEDEGEEEKPEVRKLEPKKQHDARRIEPQAEERAEQRAQVALPPHRYAYFIGAAFLVGGLAFTYSAQSEAKRAETIGIASEASAALNNARAAAATSNVMYGLAATSLAVALLFEVLPEPAAQKASLTFHF
jgi:hypothetical protein